MNLHGYKLRLECIAAFKNKYIKYQALSAKICNSSVAKTQFITSKVVRVTVSSPINRHTL
jgi:hypothetical protein